MPITELIPDHLLQDSLVNVQLDMIGRTRSITQAVLKYPSVSSRGTLQQTVYQCMHGDCRQIIRHRENLRVH